MNPVEPDSQVTDGPRPARLDIAKDWLPRYTGMSIDEYGDYVPLTNFRTGSRLLNNWL